VNPKQRLPDAKLSDPQSQAARLDWRAALRDSFGPSFAAYLALMLVTGVGCYYAFGTEVFHETLKEDVNLVLDLLPRVIAAQLVAGLIWVLVPREQLSALLNRYRGMRGLMLATVAGVLTPGGPATAFPLLALLAMAGAESGLLVTYITSWALLGIQRIVIWDTPFMGIEFTLIRVLISLPLPIIAGLLAQQFSRNVHFADVLVEKRKSK